MPAKQVIADLGPHEVFCILGLLAIIIRLQRMVAISGILFSHYFCGNRI